MFSAFLLSNLHFVWLLAGSMLCSSALMNWENPSLRGVVKSDFLLKMFIKKICCVLFCAPAFVEIGFSSSYLSFIAPMDFFFLLVGCTSTLC